jgi:hypothetical protein
MSPMTEKTDQTDLFGGIALGVATLAALLVANSPLGPEYSDLIQTTVEIRIGSIGLAKSLEHCFIDGLMATFSCWSAWRSRARQSRARSPACRRQRFRWRSKFDDSVSPG